MISPKVHSINFGGEENFQPHLHSETMEVGLVKSNTSHLTWEIKGRWEGELKEPIESFDNGSWLKIYRINVCMYFYVFLERGIM